MKLIKTFENFHKTPHHIFWDIMEHSFDKHGVTILSHTNAKSVVNFQDALDVAKMAQEHMNKSPEKCGIISKIFFDRADELDKN